MNDTAGQDAITALAALGQFPAAEDADPKTVMQQQKLLGEVRKPVSDDDAKKLAALFGPDDYYGLAWAMLHCVESSPGWPVQESLSLAGEEWGSRLRARLCSR